MPGRTSEGGEERRIGMVAHCSRPLPRHSDVDTIEFRPQNVGGYGTPMPTATREVLSEYFAPHNARLESLLGMTFNWN